MIVSSRVPTDRSLNGPKTRPIRSREKTLIIPDKADRREDTFLFEWSSNLRDTLQLHSFNTFTLQITFVYKTTLIFIFSDIWRRWALYRRSHRNNVNDRRYLIGQSYLSAISQLFDILILSLHNTNSLRHNKLSQGINLSFTELRNVVRLISDFTNYL